MFFQKERQAKESDEETRLAEMNERERRDYDLARRLALETGGEADLPHLQRTRRPIVNQKHDLTKHTYAQLRDLINTSCGETKIFFNSILFSHLINYSFRRRIIRSVSRRISSTIKSLSRVEIEKPQRKKFIGCRRSGRTK